MKKKKIIEILKKKHEKKKITTIELYLYMSLYKKINSTLFLFIFCLNYFERRGHTCLPKTFFLKKKFLLINNYIIIFFWEKIIKEKIEKIKNIIKKFEKKNKKNIEPIIIYKKYIYLYKNWYIEDKITNYLIPFFTEKTTHKIKENTKIIITEKKLNNLQKIAISIMILKKISFIIGGPGTGKTTVLIYALIYFIKNKKKKINIKLIAPTGKSADRITQLLRNKILKKRFNSIELKNIPRNATTIHHLFCIHKETNKTINKKYIHKKIKNIDILIIDESSMIDFNIAENIFKNINKKTKIIFFGDIHQLTPIENGSFLFEICKNAKNQYSEKISQNIKKMINENVLINNNINKTEQNIHDCIVILEKNYRCQKIKKIATINQKIINEKKILMKEIDDPKDNTFIIKKLDNSKDFKNMIKYFLKKCNKYMKDIKNKEPEKILHILNKFKILCAVKKGILGFKNINNIIEEYIYKKYFFKKNKKKIKNWYHGKPIMIKKNNKMLGLFNGDTGICLFNKKKKLKIFFLSKNTGKIREFNKILIKEYETAWATTIHKSQGLEFDETCVIFPNYENKILNRKLFYTAITRSKKKTTIFSNKKILKKIMNKNSKKNCNLNKKLKEKICGSWI